MNECLSAELGRLFHHGPTRVAACKMQLKLSQNQSTYHDHMIIGYSIFARCGAPVSAACNMSLPYTLIFFSQLNQNPLSLLLDDNESHNGVASNCGTANPNPSPSPNPNPRLGGNELQLSALPACQLELGFTPRCNPFRWNCLKIDQPCNAKLQNKLI